MFTLTIGGESQVEKNNSNFTNSSFFLIFSKLNNKIPSKLKILFGIFFWTILILKIFGFNVLSIFLTKSYILKIISYTLLSLVISFNLLNLYILHRFSTRKIKISEIFPEFIIKWLKEISEMSSNKAGIKEFKTNCYIEITVYITLMLLTIIITNLL